MSKIRTALSLLREPYRMVAPLDSNRMIDWMSDKHFAMLTFRSAMGCFPNLKSPRTFNEKLQWLKLYDHDPRYVDLVDKIKAKEVVGKLIGFEHIVPLLGSWDSISKVDFNSLPSRFVLKCNHDQGSVKLILNKTDMDKDAILQFYDRKLRRNNYYGTREFAYKSITPMVFAEELLGSDIIDYKFYCFNGVPKFLYCGQGLTIDHTLKIDFFDLEWNRMPFYRTDYDRLGVVQCPKHLNEMVEIARLLSKDVPFVRIDLFEVKDRVYFSEFTLCPASGLMPFEPKEYDGIVGEWIELPEHKK